MLELGCDVTFANNGQEAVQILTSKQGDFDIVFMDIQMPVMDGLTVTREIRKFESDKGKVRTPIIALTANAMKSDEEKCRKAGMDGYLSKPVRKQSVVSELARWVDTYEEQDAIREDSHNIGDGSSDFMDMEVFNTYIKIAKDKAPAMLQKTLDAIKQSISEIEENARSGNYEEVSKIAHKLKSSSCQIGAREFSNIMAKMEEVAKSDSPEDVLEYLQASQEEFAPLEAFINSFMSSNS